MGILFIGFFIGLIFQIEPPQVITETNETNEINVTKPVRIFNLSDTNRTGDRQGKENEEREPNVYVFENPQDYFYLPSKPDKNLSLIIDWVHVKVNDERRKRNLTELKRNSGLEEWAQTHSERMTRTKHFTKHDDGRLKQVCGEKTFTTS